MLRHFGIGVLWGLGGYVLGVVVCFLLVTVFSSKRHDLNTESIMTAFFAGGPLVAIIGFIVGVIYSVKSS